ncbi:hypothetical protein BZM27_27580 [Paraburkholderia steynii]|uniref:Uncharacterized protein n=1 Tax=Paraburkholderia steynii TaxID=1245441 RepID=A0A4V2NGU1_9BURK|nr:hypothetical protein BZM27_27580 [Paraburkholderia steynii]
MTGHLNAYTSAERFALDCVANLHDQLRAAVGTNTRFCTHGAADLLEVATVIADALDRCRADTRLLRELGRRQLTKLNLGNVPGVPGGMPEDELLAAYRDDALLVAGGKVALEECCSNLLGWLRAANAMLDAGDGLRH